MHSPAKQYYGNVPFISPGTGYPTHFSRLVCRVTGQIDPALRN